MEGLLILVMIVSFCMALAFIRWLFIAADEFFEVMTRKSERRRIERMLKKASNVHYIPR